MQINRSITTALIFLLGFSSAFAQTKEKVQIKEATVFLRGAELFSTASVSVTSGETEILFTNIAGNVNQQSLNVGASNGVVVQSAIFQNNYLVDETLSPRAKDIKDSIEYLEGKMTQIKNSKTVVNEQINIINQNKQVSGSQTGLSVSELQKMLDLVKNKMAGLLKEQNDLSKDYDDANKDLQKLRQQLEQERQKGYQPGGQLLVKFYSTRSTNSNITISYVVPNAGWIPSYDIRVDKINAPVELYYKAHVFQNSGVSWDKVKLSLSTGNPTEGAQAPTLNPWHLSLYQAPRPMAKSSAGYQNNVVVNSYQVPLIDKYDATKDKRLNSDEMESMPTRSTIDNYVYVQNSGINTEFDIDLPYTIPSDGQKHNVSIKRYELPATYRYYSVPKLDRDVFLQARVTNWEDLNLMPASTNIFFEGTYIGQGYIDMRNVKDTMNISLGRDKKIIVRRERDKEVKSVKTIGTNVKETFVYKLTVRNTRKEAAEIVLIDQVPVSNDNNIEVQDINNDGGELDENTGAVVWQLKLGANEAKELKLGYTVKYPKGERVNNL